MVPPHKPLLNVLACYFACCDIQKQRYNLIVCGVQFRPVQFKKNFCDCCSNAFVAIHERMGLCKMIGISCGTGDKRRPFVVGSVSCCR